MGFPGYDEEIRVGPVLSSGAEMYVAAKMPFLEKGKKDKKGRGREDCTRGSPSIADEAGIRLRLELEAEPCMVLQPWAHLPALSSLC